MFTTDGSILEGTGRGAGGAGAPALVLSVVIPMYNESARIGDTLRDVVKTLDAWGVASEVITVDDGSTDGCGELVRSIADELADGGSGAARGVRVLTQARNRGKGAAVRRGLRESRGAWVLMMDADNSARLGELSKLAAAASRSRVGLAVGSRNHPDSVVKADPKRKLSGAVFRLVLGALGLSFVRDTQCGFKLYRRDTADLCARRAVEDGFAFDLEHIGLAERSGLGVVEVGIAWVHRDGGSISVVRDGLKMIGQARRIRTRLHGIEARSAIGTDAPASVLELKPLTGARETEHEQAIESGAA